VSTIFRVGVLDYCQPSTITVRFRFLSVDTKYELCLLVLFYASPQKPAFNSRCNLIPVCPILELRALAISGKIESSEMSGQRVDQCHDSEKTVCPITHIR